MTTLGGAGVLHGDLTPECAAAVQAIQPNTVRLRRVLAGTSG